MKALVTGATGYIGSKLCQRLLAEGWEVDVLIRSSGRPLAESLAGKVSLRTYDGNTQSVLDSVSAAKPDLVFHLASLFIAEHRSEQVTDLINSNVLFGTQLIEACSRFGVKRFINTGTSWQHYRSEAYDPVCLYAATKQAFEDILDFYADAFDLRVVTLKLFDTYGADDPRPKLVNLLRRHASSQEPLLMSPGAQKIDLVHIDDVCNAFLQATRLLADTNGAPSHQRYAVSTGQARALREIVEIFIEATGQNLAIRWGERPYRAREVMTPIGGAILPGWRPQHELSCDFAEFAGGPEKVFVTGGTGLEDKLPISPSQDSAPQTWRR